jgi:hypothetical protein
VKLDKYQRKALRTGDNVKLNEYQSGAKETAIYPGELVYPALGLCGEIGELFDAMDKGVWEEIPKEIGDVLWYVANVAADADLTLSEVMGRKTFPNNKKLTYAESNIAIKEIVFMGGVVAENVKKTLRDDAGVLCEKRRKNIKVALKDIVINLVTIGWDYCEDQLEDIAKANIEKLLSRQERGKLTGDGDNR